MGKTITVSSPGKVILHGEHAVVYGKEAIACAIDLRTNCQLEIKPLSGNNPLQISVKSFNLQEKLSYSTIEGLVEGIDFSESPLFLPRECVTKIKDITEISDDHLKNLGFLIIIALYLAIAKQECLKWSITLAINSDVPIGAGLGSSASYGACLAAVFLLAFEKIVPTPSGGKKFDDEDLKLINQYVFETEKLVHGTPSGIDNTICTYGGALSFKEGKITPGIRLPPLRVLVVNTNIPRSTKDLVAGVKERYNRHPSIYSIIFEAIEKIVLSAESCYRSIAKVAEDGDEIKLKQLFQDAQDYLNLNHDLLRSIGVSHPSLDKISDICRQYGLSSKLTGAGGGGCSFSIIPPDFLDSVLEEARKTLHDCGFSSWIAHIGCSGVRIDVHSKEKDD